MRYLKTFKKINESGTGECDFDTFKEIMYEITDDFSVVEFNDYSNEGFYDCWIDLRSKFRTYDGFEMNFGYLAYIIEPYDLAYNISHVLEDGKVYTVINSYLDKLHEVKSNIDDFIKSNEEVLKLFKNIEEFILPRFEKFDNFIQANVGIRYDEIRITFEMVEEE